MTQKSPYQTLKGLKKKSYLLWCYLHDIEEKFGDTFAECYIQFKQDSRSLGDLRYKVTWERVWATLKADHLWENLDDNGFLIRTFTQYAPEEGWEHLIALILDRLLQNQEALACLKRGFERIVQLSPNAVFTAEKQLFDAVQAALARRAETATRRSSFATAA